MWWGSWKWRIIWSFGWCCWHESIPVTVKTGKLYSFFTDFYSVLHLFNIPMLKIKEKEHVELFLLENKICPNCQRRRRSTESQFWKHMLELWILDIFYCEKMKDTDGKQAMQVFAFDDTIWHFFLYNQQWTVVKV